jgi:hypothetical protein
MSRWIGAVPLLVLAVSGCLHAPPRWWPGSGHNAEHAERDKDLAEVRTIGDVTEVGNAGPLQVHGVGLVTGLEGTGGSPRGEFRAMLEKDLRQRRVLDVAKILDSKDNALVLVTAFIPAGARKLEPLDIEITLPQGSPCTSLRGGYLQSCSLRNYEATKNINPEYEGGNRLLQGHILAVAKGPLLVGFGNPGELAELKRARIWEGGSSLIERPYVFVLKKDDKSAKIANAIANRINLKFPDDARKHEAVHRQRHLYLLEDVTQQLNNAFEPAGPGNRGDVAKALNMELVNVRVPYAYRYNPERYLRVARLIPFQEDAEAQARYRARLQKMLAEPQDAIRAALRLEALGKESVAALKQGLQSEHPLGRFASAEALVYLGEVAGVDELAAAARTQPSVRAYALVALAGLDEAVCRTRLNELLNSDDAELRAGAFQALRLAHAQTARTEAELESAMARLGGENLGSFWLHRVAPGSRPAVNFAAAKRAEIILFGDDVRLSAATEPVRVRAGQEFTVTVGQGEDRCFVSRIPVGGNVARRQCSLHLEEVLRALVELGGQYPDAVELLRNLDEQQGLNCAVRRLAPPQALPLEELLAETAASQARPDGGN